MPLDICCYLHHGEVSICDPNTPFFLILPLPLQPIIFHTMRYWRHYPRLLQLALLLLLVFTLVSFSLVIANFFAVKIYGVGALATASLNMQSPPKLIAAAKLVQTISSLFSFFGSALLFAYLAHPKPLQYVGMRKVVDKKQFIIVLVLMLAIIPILTQIGSWLQLLPLGKDALANQKQTSDMMTALLQMNNSLPGLLLNLFIFALLPAVGEELLFRGVALRMLYNYRPNIHFAILFSAIFFALMHAQVFNLLPIMMAGILLGYIYYLSGSIWLSIFAHFIYNGVQVVAIYLSNSKSIPEQAANMENYPWYILGLSLATSAFAIVLLVRNATPLPQNWNNDFEDIEQQSL